MKKLLIAGLLSCIAGWAHADLSGMISGSGASATSIGGGTLPSNVVASSITAGALANIRTSSFTMDSPLNFSDETGLIFWADTSNSCLGNFTNCGRGAAFLNNTVVGASAFNGAGGFNGKTWSGNTVMGYLPAALFGANGEHVYNNTCIGALSCGGNSGGISVLDKMHNTAVGWGALGGNSFSQTPYGLTAIGDSAGVAQSGSSNTYVGAYTTGAGGIDHCTAIGFGANCPASNLLILGSVTPLVTTLSGPIQISTNMGSGYMVAVSSIGHFNVYTTSPTISSCGSGPNGRVTGNDVVGTITVGGGVVTACTLTFVKAFKNPPVCLVSDNSGTVAVGITSIATTGFTATSSASLGGGSIFYHCIGVD